MHIELNGDPTETRSATLAELIAEHGFEAEAVATALNGTFVPRPLRASAALSPGDKVEVLTPMQGG